MRKLIAVLLIALLALSACAKDGSTDESAQDSQPDSSESADTSEIQDSSESSDTELKNEINNTIVIPKGSNRYGTFTYDIISKISGEISSLAGKTPKLIEDNKAEVECEIVLGNTARKENPTWRQEAGNDGWWVQKEGDKIFVGGASKYGLLEAVDYFLENMTVKDGKIEFPTAKFMTVSKSNAIIGTGLSLKIVTFNIKNGSGVGHDMSVLAEDIKALDPDIVGLQEVDIETNRAGGKDTLKLLAEAAGYQYYYFAKTIDHDGGEYGTAVMSRYPIESFEVVPLYNEGSYEARTVGHAVVNVNGIKVDFFNTHLTHQSKTVRGKQFKQINSLASNSDTFIVTADFNTESKAELSIIENSVRANDGMYVTYPHGGSSIDDIIAQCNWTVTDSDAVNIGDHSDHNLFWAELVYTG